jgi:hypothetical protein
LLALFRFRGYGPDAGPGGGGIEWIEKCDWCAKREAERQAQLAAAILADPS